jgi:hypothetical protein
MKYINLYIINIIFIIIIILYIIKEDFSYKKERYKNYNIAVCMWYDKNIEEYGNISRKINQIYCDKNNYDLIFSNNRLLPDRHPSWECIPLLLNTLNENKYDYIIWIDADACFNLKSRKNIENIIYKYKNKDIIFSGDYNNNIINAGIIILKNSNISKQFCLNIINSKNNKECYKHFNKSDWEQSCIIELYNKNIDNIKNVSVIMPYKILQIFPHLHKKHNKNSIILHYAGTDKKKRIEELNKIYINL